jgi:[Skp1-protein]-hydroxyproline N-acetylglucosaminyltransferase
MNVVGQVNSWGTSPWGNTALMTTSPEQRRKKKRLGSASSGDGGMIRIVMALIAGAGSAFLLAILMLASRLENVIDEQQQQEGIPPLRGGAKMMSTNNNNNAVAINNNSSNPVIRSVEKVDSNSVSSTNKRIKDRLFFPALPPHLMAEELYGSEIITNLLEHNEPSIAGIIALIQRFLSKYHKLLIKHRDQQDAVIVLKDYFALLDEILHPFEVAYRNKSIFPTREDQSIFISLASYRDHLLGETLRQAFQFAAYPDKLYIGAVVQNCFGLDNVTCKTGVEVQGKDANGNWITKISNKPPDVNGIEEFCTDPMYVKYCNSGQIRVIYVNETESNGPTQARYFASKLWGGETYFMQADAHLRFVPEWDRLYHEEILLAKSYPKAILSTYPPGFNVQDPPYEGGTVCPRLCECEFSEPDDGMIRINTGHDCRKEGEQHVPTQVAYIAAGFFFTRSEWLTDVPFDPYLPFIFMGEEIM